MKKSLTLTLIVAFIANLTNAQVQISTGAGYQSQTFYTLANDGIKTIKNTEWDLAFSVYGQQDGGIFINEAAGSSQGQALPSIELYKTSAKTFQEVILETSINTKDDRLYNDEKGKSWAYGAFNETRVKTNTFDYGWGIYNTGNKVVEGKFIYAVKGRDGKFRKMEIQNLTGVVYQVRHANLDGTDEKTFTVDKNQFKGKTFAYYSFATNSTSDIEPANFDLWFTRYVSYVTQGTTTAQYNVTGILSGRGVKVAKATAIDPEKVQYWDYRNQVSSQLDTIGSDWKTVDITTGKWTVPADRAYFVVTKNGDIYKIVFIDFEGSATGTATFSKMKIGNVDVSDISSDIRYKVFPTVVQDEINIAFDTPTNETFDLSIIDMNGRVVVNQKIETSGGFQVKTLDVSNLLSGTYVARLASKNGIATSKIIK
jgi:Secretion system C-terminal sorting domain